MSRDEDNRLLRDDLVCFKRPLLVRICNRYKLRGYTKVKKCDLVKALLELTQNLDQYPIAPGRKTRDIMVVLGRSRPKKKKASKKVKKRTRAKKTKKVKKKAVYESDSDEDVPLVRKGSRGMHVNDWSQDTVQFSPVSS